MGQKKTPRRSGELTIKAYARGTLTLGSVVPNADEEENLLGMEGIAHSDLRPGGTAYFGDRKIDVVTYGDYIARQSPVRIVEVHGNRIVVEDLSLG